VRAQIDRGTPFLGICLGLQALFESSEEALGRKGLGLFPGTNVRLPDGERDSTGAVLKIPHMGWNRIELAGSAHPYLREAGGEGTYFYFTHSYHAVPSDRSLLVATTRHGPMTITAAVARDNVFASQFHPEKSQGAGLRLLGAFLKG
jgi:glutamine amidotransferase